MRTLVLGGSGMLGQDLVAELQKRTHKVVAPPHFELDITDPVSMARIATGDLGKFDWCFNCAAYTAVDQAELEQEQAVRVNALGPGYLSAACSIGNIRLTHLSTDYVFDGNANKPYKEEEQTNPLGVYARTKLEGEEAVLHNAPDAVIVRTSWLYGPTGKCFPNSIMAACLAGKQLQVVNDQKGCPTYTTDLAQVIVDLAELKVYGGIYHAVGPESISWFEFARRIVKTLEKKHVVPKVNREILPITTQEWPTLATRPRYSVLSNQKIYRLGIKPMRPVNEALQNFFDRIKA